MPSMASVRPSWKQEPGTSLRSPTSVAIATVLVPLLCPRCVSRKLGQNGVVRYWVRHSKMECGHPLGSIWICYTLAPSSRQIVYTKPLNTLPLMWAIYFSLWKKVYVNVLWIFKWVLIGFGVHSRLVQCMEFQEGWDFFLFFFSLSSFLFFLLVSE